MCKFTLETIHKVAEGKVSPKIIDEPFILMKSKTKMRFVKDFSGTEYALVFGNRIRTDQTLADEIIIDQDIADKLKNIYKMNKITGDKSTVLYEQPGKPFLNKYKHQGLRRVYN